LPAIPFTLSEGDAGPAEGAETWPEDVRVEQQPGPVWVIRNDRGDYWCEALGNGWIGDPDEEMPPLTFPSREEAEAAYSKAARMYRQRKARHDTAMARLDELEETGGQTEG
jgi:hypothetical protein